MINLKNILSQNELTTLRCVYEAGPISRVKVAQKMHLTRASVTNITKKLIDLDLIQEVGKGASTERRGRREVLLTANSEAGYVLTVHIALSYFTIGLLDLAGRVIEKSNHPIDGGSSPQVVLDCIIDKINEISAQHHIKKPKIFGVVIAIPGILNYKEGYVREMPMQGWQGFKIKAYLESRIDIKVLLENDVKTYTLGEFHFGTGRHVNEMICLWMGDGIGAGIVSNGRLIRGSSSSAGEVGFNEFILDPPATKSILTAESPRCWGDALSITNIKATIKRGVAEGWKTILTKDAEISDFVHAVESGDPLGVYIFRLLSSILAVMGRNLIYTFNPEILLISGPLVYKLPRLAGEVRSHLDKGILHSPLENVEIKTSMLGDNGILIGGVALMLDYLFNQSDNHFAD